MPTDLPLCAMLILATSTDLATRRIPNLVPLSGLLFSGWLALQSPEPKAALLACGAGLLVGFSLFLPFYLMRGMAAGDVKLMAAVGAFVGPQLALRIGLLTFVVGGVLAVLLLLVRGRFLRGLANVGVLMQGALQRSPNASAAPAFASVGGIPYAVAIALSTIGVLSWQRW